MVFTYQVTASAPERQQQNQTDYDTQSATNPPHGESQQFIDFYEAKNNIDLKNALFDIAPQGDADFAAYELSNIVYRRLDNPSKTYRKEFREFMFDSLKTIKAQQNTELAGFGVVMVENFQKEISARRREEGAENDPDLNEEIAQLYTKMRELANDATIHPQVRGKALHYLDMEQQQVFSTHK